MKKILSYILCGVLLVLTALSAIGIYNKFFVEVENNKPEPNGYVEESIGDEGLSKEYLEEYYYNSQENSFEGGEVIHL